MAQDSDWGEIIHLYKQHIDEIDATKAEDNRLRDLFRKGGDVAGIAAGLIRMIPDEKGLSVLREGLGYVILVCLSLLMWYIECTSARHPF